MAIQVGNNGANTLTGTSGIDLLIGRGGNDTLSGGGKLDLLLGGKGNDVLDGGKGYDLLLGGKGDDVVVSVDADLMDGGKGTDTAVLLRETSTANFKIDMSCSLQFLADGTIMTGFERLVFFGGSGNDVIKGGSLNDFISGGAGADQLYGNNGDDILLGNATDKLYGGAGNDVISITALPALVDGGAGVDTLRVVGPLVFTPGIVQNVEKVEIVDGFFNFNLTSGAGDEVSFNNFYDPSGGPLTTGAGLSIEVVQNLLPGEPATTTGYGVQIQGSSHDDLIVGSSGNDRFDGGRGNDTLHGGGGSDVLDGQTGLDLLYGDAGDDFLYSKNSDGADILLDGGDGFDFAQIERTKFAAGFVLDVSNAAVQATGNDGLRVIGVEQFHIEGGAGADRITTGFGDDLIETNAGADSLYGGGGNDGLRGGAGNDLLDGGDGFDTAILSGKLSNYSIVHNLDGSYTVTDLRAGSPDGTDTLYNVEQLSFSNALPGHGDAFLLV